MRRMLRIYLAGIVALALTASGIPFVHASAFQSRMLPASHAVHGQTALDSSTSDVGMHADHTGSSDSKHNSCKDLSCCSMCAMSYVAPAARLPAVHRTGYAVPYLEPSLLTPRAASAVDPGIPIV